MDQCLSVLPLFHLIHPRTRLSQPLETHLVHLQRYKQRIMYLFALNCPLKLRKPLHRFRLHLLPLRPRKCPKGNVELYLELSEEARHMVANLLFYYVQHARKRGSQE